MPSPLPLGDYQETRAVLAQFAKSVNIEHSDDVKTKAQAEKAVAAWLTANQDNTQFPFIGAHGILDRNDKCIGLGASGGAGAFATWQEVWDWFSKGEVTVGLWLGACKSSDAAAAFSPIMAAGRRCPFEYILGFRESIYPKEIEAILRQSIKNTNLRNCVYLDQELDSLRAAAPGTTVEKFYRAHSLAKVVEYVNVDEFVKRVGVTFRKHLENGG